MDFGHGVTVTVERPSGWDQYGNPLDPSAHTVKGCGIAPAGSTEQQTDSATVEWDIDLLVPYGGDFTAEDVVLLPDDDQRYQVHGRPQQFKSPFTGWEAGAVVRLKGVQG